MCRRPVRRRRRARLVEATRGFTQLGYSPWHYSRRRPRVRLPHVTRADPTLTAERSSGPALVGVRDQCGRALSTLCHAGSPSLGDVKPLALANRSDPRARVLCERRNRRMELRLVTGTEGHSRRVQRHPADPAVLGRSEHMHVVCLESVDSRGAEEQRVKGASKYRLPASSYPGFLIRAASQLASWPSGRVKTCSTTVSCSWLVNILRLMSARFGLYFVALRDIKG